MSGSRSGIKEDLSNSEIVLLLIISTSNSGISTILDNLILSYCKNEAKSKMSFSFSLFIVSSRYQIGARKIGWP